MAIKPFLPIVASITSYALLGSLRLFGKSLRVRGLVHGSVALSRLKFADLLSLELKIWSPLLDWPKIIIADNAAGQTPKCWSFRRRFMTMMYESQRMREKDEAREEEMEKMRKELEKAKRDVAALRILTGALKRRR